MEFLIIHDVRNEYHCINLSHVCTMNITPEREGNGAQILIKTRWRKQHYTVSELSKIQAMPLSEYTQKFKA